MAARGKKNLEFTIDLQFVNKANSEIDDYVSKLTKLKSQFGERLAGGFLDDTIKKLQSGQKAMENFSKIVNNPKIAKQEKLGRLDSTAEELKGLSRMMKNLDKIWMTDAIKNNQKVLDQLDEIRSKQKSLSAVKGNITKNQNSMNRAENDLRSTGYVGGTTAKDANALQVQLNKNKKALEGNFDNKDLLEENKLLEKQITLIEKIVKARKKGAEYNKQVSSLSAIDGKAGVTDTDAASKRLGNKEQVLLAKSEDIENVQKFNEEIAKIPPTIDEATSATLNFGDLGEQAWEKAQEEIKRTEEAAQTLKQVLAQFGIGISAVQIVNYFKDLTNAAFDFYKSLDYALNQIYVVSGLTSDAVMGLKDKFITMSKESGMAIDDIAQSAVLFYQQGLDTDAVLEMTEVTAQFAKVAGIDATDAADKLTAAVNGYCLSAEDAASVADKFNQVAAASAADINELSTAFSKAAAQANQAGVSMDNYLAYIATMEEATREAPENIGTSLKTIFSRMDQIKNAGSSEDGETDVNQVETALKSVGVALRDSENQLRNLEDVLDELGGKWNSLDINTQAYLGTIIAGTRQQSRFITLMQNWDRVLELSEESADSAGMQALMHAKSMDSLNSSLQQATNAWQTFLSNLTESKTIRGLVDLFTKLIKTINSGNKPFLLLSTAFLVLSKRIGKFSGPIKKLTTNIQKGLLKTMKGLSKENLKNATSYIKHTKEITKHTKAIKSEEKNLVDLTEKNKKLSEQQQEIIQNTGLEGDQLDTSSDAYQRLNQSQQACVEQYNNLGKEIAENNEKRAESVQKINQEKEALQNSVPDLEKEKAGFEDITASLDNMSIGLSSLAMMTKGTTSNLLAMASGVTSFASTATTAVETLAAAEDMSIILLLIKLGPLILKGFLAAINIVKSAIEIFGKQDEKLAESMSNISGALDDYNDKVTQLNSANKLMKTYDDLSKRMYLTAEEQEKLNDTVESLADAFDLETVEDGFGNVTVSVTQLKDAMEELEAQTKEAREELIKTEDEEAEKWDGTRKRREKFYNEYLSKNKTKITSGMVDIEYDIDTDKLKADAATINEINATLQSGIVDYTKSIGGSFKDGLTATEYIDNMMDSINSAVDDKSWNALFGEVSYLQDEIDNLTYSEVSAKLDKFFENWAKDLGLTQAEIEAVRKSIEGTLYASSNIDDTISNYQSKLDKNGADYYNKQIADLKKQRAEAEKNSGTFWNPFAKDDYEKQYEQLGRQIKNLEKDRADMVGQLTDEEKNKYESMIDVLGNLTNATAAAMDQADMFKDIVNSNGETIMSSEQLLQNMDLTGINSAFKQGDNKGVEKLMQELQKQIAAADTDELKEALQDKLDSVVNSLTMTGHISWGNLADDLDKASEKLRSMNSIMQEFADEGGISLDTFAELCDILDSIDLSAVFDAGMMDEYLTALDKLNLGFDASTGYITAEGEAMQTLQDIQEIATKAEIQAEINKLEVRKASLQSQLAMISAEMATNEALITYLADKTDAEIELDTLKTMANANYAKNMGTASEKITGYYTTLTSNSSKWAEVTIANAAQVGEAFNKLASGDLDAAAAQSYLNGIISGAKFEGIDKSGLDGLADNGKTIKGGDALAALQSYQEKLGNTYSDITSQIKNIDGQITLLTKLKDADLGKLGAEGKDDKDKSIDKYIGKLKEIYNILNKIETAEHRLSTLDTYASSATGKTYANNLQERIKLSKQLMGNYDNLIRAQKDLVASEQKAIKDSPVGDVFSFDQYGTIQIDYEKYLALQDESIDGKMTLKELADNLYDEYEELYDQQKDYFDQKIAYLEKVIELEQEQVDAYVELEHDLAEAVKDIYQDMLDEKLDAIDKEMEALDELQEAYEDANKARDDSREISKMQTDLRRSMMDTSGASNTKQLSYQDQIQQKLEEMGEDEYTKRLDDIREALEKQQELLQDQFDEFFDDYEQLYKMIEERILGSEEAVNEVLKTTSEWKEAAPAERAQMLTSWNTRYETAMAGLTGGATIMDVVTDIELLHGSIDELDKIMRENGDPSRIGKEISTALTEYYLSQEQKNDSSTKDKSFSAGGSGVKVSGSPSTADLSDYDTKVDLSLLDQASSKMDKIKESVGSWWSNLCSKLGEFWNKAVEAVKNFFTQTIPNFISQIPELIGKLGAMIVNFFFGTLPTAVGNFFSWLGDMGTKVWEWLKSLPGKFMDAVAAIGQWISEIPEKLKEIGTNIWNWFTSLPEKFQEAVAAIGEWLSGIKDRIGEWFNGIGEWFKEAFSNLINGIKDIGIRIWNSFTSNLSDKAKENLEKVGQFFSDVFNGIKDKVSEIWGHITDFFSGIWEKGEEILTKVGDFFGGIIDGIKEKFSGAWDSIKEGASNAWNGITEVFSKIPEWFREKFASAWQKVKDVFSSGGQIFAGIKDGIVDAVKGVVNKLRDGFNWVIKQPFNWLNGILNTIRNIGFLGIEPFKGLWKENPIGVPQIPAFKTGGMADFTGPAWLDGTRSEPEAVLNAAQTKAFMRIADNLDKLEGVTNVAGASSAVNIENISFQVESMSSPEDGEAAFDAFIAKFKEIGSQSGLTTWQTRKA